MDLFNQEPLCAQPGRKSGCGPQVMMPSYIKVTPGREFDTLGVVKEQWLRCRPKAEWVPTSLRHT